VAVGAPFQAQGAVYLFLCLSPSSSPSSSPCVQTQKLVPADGREGDRFGHSVSVYGSTVAVGAPYHDVGNHADQGACYVYHCPASSGCTQTSKLVSSNGSPADFFGTSVSLSGTSLAVGAHGSDVQGRSQQGAVYVYDCPLPSLCSQAAILVASDGGEGDHFGYSVSVAGSALVAGAHLHDLGGGHDQGAAYVFDCSSPSSCFETSKLVASDRGTGDFFGYSVAISGPLVAVGALFHNEGDHLDQGAAYVFDCSILSACSELAKLTASDGMRNDWFGGSVSISNSAVAVGAFGHNLRGIPRQGSVYLFDCSSFISCFQTDMLAAQDASIGDYFGHSVSISGPNLVVGAYGKNLQAGAAYFIDLDMLANPFCEGEDLQDLELLKIVPANGSRISLQETITWIFNQEIDCSTLNLEVDPHFKVLVFCAGKTVLTRPDEDIPVPKLSQTLHFHLDIRSWLAGWFSRSTWFELGSLAFFSEISSNFCFSFLALFWNTCFIFFILFILIFIFIIFTVYDYCEEQGNRYCNNNGVCVFDELRGVSCHCLNGFFGEYCENSYSSFSLLKKVSKQLRKINRPLIVL